MALFNTTPAPAERDSELRGSSHEPSPEPTILYFGNDWYAENRTSSHHIARRLARSHRMLYIECPGLRAPRGTRRDLKKIWTKISRFLSGPKPVAENLKLWTLLQIPFHRFAFIRRLNVTLILVSLRWIMWREGIRRPIAWFMIPHPAPLVGRLGERLSVYYCTDDYASMPGVNAEAVRAMDTEMARKSDIVFVTSETLLDSKLQLNRETHTSPHGVDIEHFGRAQDEQLPAPTDMAEMSHPVIGFFGLIESWIDLDLVAFLAEQRPNWTFVFIGRLAVPAEQLQRRPNVHFLGNRAYEDLPAYGKHFDVAIIPYRLNRQVMHANPLKLREYLAMGKPVVAVRTAEIEKYSDVVAIADSREEFLAKLDDLLSRPDSPMAIERRMSRVASVSWDARLARVFGIVRSRLDDEEKRAGAERGVIPQHRTPGPART